MAKIDQVTCVKLLRTASGLPVLGKMRDYEKISLFSRARCYYFRLTDQVSYLISLCIKTHRDTYFMRNIKYVWPKKIETTRFHYQSESNPLDRAKIKQYICLCYSKEFCRD